MRSVLAVLVLSSSVHAETTDEDPFVFVAPQFAFGAPLGLLGLEAGVGVDWLRASVGAGLGSRGTQIGVMGRAFGEMRGVDVGIGIGVSRGPGPDVFTLPDEDLDDERFPNGYPLHAAETTWGNVEIDVEVPIATFAFFRFFAGASYAVLPECELESGMRCHGGEERELSPWLPYVGVAAVVRFPDGPDRQTFQMPASPATQPPWWGY